MRVTQSAGFALLCLAAVPLVLVLPADAAARFRGYGMGLPPVVMLAASGLAGAVALAGLDRLGFFMPGPRQCRAGIIRAVALGSALAVPTILVDLAHPFPATMNAAFPASLIFYPSIALVAEAAFHLVPLALLLTLLRRPLVAIALAACVEPVFQTAFAAPGEPIWQTAFVAVNVFAIGFLQIVLLRRYGIAALLALRLTYYLWWHIVWGGLRLEILF